ncbi:MAG: tetratricopeptide repeat protein [Gammaproteobacteria bacterium]|jgi:tetratricopeptide (TPR) repeat protein|nr:tetratricopeptide repeat protein [Gammaproteobacteria bacterium]
MSSNSIKEQYDQALKTLRAGDAQEAELICRRVLPQSRQDPNIMCLLGEICLRQRRPQEAENLFRKVLKRHREYPRALEGIGLALLADGKPKKASEILTKAVAASPKRSTTRMALARALAESGHQVESENAIQEAFRLNPRKAAIAEAERATRDGRMEDAEKALRELLAKDPNNARALRMLGSIALEANRYKAARRLLERAVELAPGVAMSWNDLANLHLKKDRYDEALEAVQRAIDIDPDFAHSYVVKGNILTRAQRHEDSLLAYQQGLEVSPQNVGALSGMGHVLKTIGRQDEAIAAFRKCIQANPAFGETYWSLANLKTFVFDPEEVQIMEEMAKRENLADEPKVNILVSLGKHYENEKDYDRAFENYQRGNDLRRQHEIYDPVHTQVVHDRIIKTFNAEFFAEKAGYGDPSPDPILIVGLPRSGSTLIEQILASHSMVEGTMELPDLGRTIADLNVQTPGRTEYPEAVMPLDKEQVASLGRDYLDATSRYRTDKPFFIDKMPNNFQAIGFLALILPNAKVIDARRHPLDSCLGSYKQLFFKGQSFTYDQFELGHYYMEYRRIMDHWHDVLPGKVLEVNYEQVVTDQENQTRRILEYCGIPWEDQCLRFYETERAINTASSEQVRQPIYTKALNFWRNYEPHLGELIETMESLLKELPEEDQPESIRSSL